MGLTEHIAHMSRKAEEEIIEILYEIHKFPSGSYYEVFWYHWPRDGLLPWEDFEPVVFVYNFKQELCFVLVRDFYQKVERALQTPMNPETVRVR